MSDGQQNIQPRRRKKGPVKKPPDRPLPLPDGGRAPSAAVHHSATF
jgi:hypothetical protein